MQKRYLEYNNEFIVSEGRAMVASSDGGNQRLGTKFEEEAERK